MTDHTAYDHGVQDAFYYLASKLRPILRCGLSPEGLTVALEAALDGYDITANKPDDPGRFYDRRRRACNVLTHLIKHTTDERLRRVYELERTAAEHVGD